MVATAAPQRWSATQYLPYPQPECFTGACFREGLFQDCFGVFLFLPQFIPCQVNAMSEDMRDRVLAVERTCDRVMRMKLHIEGEVWHIISFYAPQVGCTKEEKDEFWEHMDAEMQAVPRSERLVVAGDLNGHVGRDRDGYEGVHGGHGLGVRNEEGIKIMDFATAYQMRLMNTYYTKRENHLVTYNSGGRRSQIDFIMLRKEYTKEC